MASITDFEDIFPHAKTMPATTEVYRNILLRLARLEEVRRLIQSDQDDKLLDCTPALMDLLYNLWTERLPKSQFRIDAMTSAEQVMHEAQKARHWLLRTVDLQARLLDRARFYRLLRSAIEKGDGEKTDMENLYITLTDAQLRGAEASLNLAFTMVLHFNFAEQYKDVLEKLEEIASRASSPLLSMSRAEAVQDRILEKISTVKVEAFACAIPLHTLTASARTASSAAEELACPVCRNSYVDFATFPINDLIADYPVKIKFCGHVIGKSCLEMWMDTPLIDPAKYPHKTCPLCRTDIEGHDYTLVPEAILSHVAYDEDTRKLMREKDLGEADCYDGIMRLLSEEIVLEELTVALDKMGGVTGADLIMREKARNVLTAKKREIREEKKVWGFGGKEGSWLKMRNLWMNAADTYAQ